MPNPRPHPHGTVSPNVTDACPTCGGGTGGFLKTGRDPDRQYHATWCHQTPIASDDTVRSVAADQAQADADIYDDYQHGCTINQIATTEAMTWSAVYAAIARHRRRIANTP